MTLTPHEIRGMWRAGLMSFRDAASQLVSLHHWSAGKAQKWLRA